MGSPRWCECERVIEIESFRRSIFEGAVRELRASEALREARKKYFDQTKLELLSHCAKLVWTRSRVDRSEIIPIAHSYASHVPSLNERNASVDLLS